MNVIFEIVNKTVGCEGEVTSVSFKAVKPSKDGNYKSYGECLFSPNVKSKEFISIDKVTDSLLVKWINLNLGDKGLKAIDKTLSDRIKLENKPKQTAKFKD